MMGRRGFTLVELLVVLAVLAILATLSVFGFARFLTDSRDTQRATSAIIISEALEKYYDNYGEYPSCPSVTGSAASVASSVLGGITIDVLKAPQAPSAGVNSLECTNLNAAGSDFYEYRGDGSAACATGDSCLSFTLRYKEEASGTVKEIHSRRGVSIATSGVPTLAASGTGLTQLTASWDMVPNALNYTVEVSANSSFSPLTKTQTTTSVSAVITDLGYNSSYHVRVRPNGSTGAGTWSNVVNASTLALSAPTLSITPNSSSQVTGTWSSVTGATGYRFEWSTNQVTWSNLATTNTSGAATGLSGGALYYFRVQARWNSSYGPYSAIVSAYTMPGSPSVPSIAAAMSGTSARGTVSGATCSGGTLQYALRHRETNTTTPGAWSAWSSWSTTTQKSVAGSEGYNYEFDAKARCLAGTTPSEEVAVASTAAVTRPFSAPSAPSVTQVTTGTNTVFTRNNITCPGNGTVSYQYMRTREGVTYTFATTTSTTVSTPSSSQGYQYGIQWQARCSNTYSTGPWSGSGTANYIRPVNPPAAYTYNGYRGSPQIMYVSVTSSCGTGASLYGYVDVYTYDWGWTPGPYYGWRRDSHGWVVGEGYKSNTTLTGSQSSAGIPSGSRWRVAGYMRCQNSTTNRNSGAYVYGESGIFYAS